VRKLCVPMLLAASSLRLFAQQDAAKQLLVNPSASTAPHPQDAQASRAAAIAFIRQVDHIVIDSDTPEALFHLFSEQLGLPLGFPYKSYGAFSSGGVGFGNVIVEFIHAQGLHPGLAGVAFEPATIEEASSTLDARGVKHDPAKPVYQPDPSGGRRLGWTTMELDLAADGFFLCKYNMSVEPRRARIRQELDARNGGPLGVDSISEVVVGVRDLAAAQNQFSSLLGPPRQGETSLWALGTGPAIRLVTDTQDHLKEVRVKVHSLQTARAYLKEQGLLGADSENELTFNSARLGDINIVLLQ
jgi:hypothetical protein